MEAWKHGSWRQPKRYLNSQVIPQVGKLWAEANNSAELARVGGHIKARQPRTALCQPKVSSKHVDESAWWLTTGGGKVKLHQQSTRRWCVHACGCHCTFPCTIGPQQPKALRFANCEAEAINSHLRQTNQTQSMLPGCHVNERRGLGWCSVYLATSKHFDDILQAHCSLGSGQGTPGDSSLLGGDIVIHRELSCVTPALYRGHVPSIRPEDPGSLG